MMQKANLYIKFFVPLWEKTIVNYTDMNSFLAVAQRRKGEYCLFYNSAMYGLKKN